MDGERIAGSLLGTAVGDAIGLPYEGLSRARCARMLGKPDRHRFLFGHGMISDDTEHACMTAQALLVSNGDVALFRRRLATRLRHWLIMMPAGVGFATARAIIRLWVAIPIDPVWQEGGRGAHFTNPFEDRLLRLTCKGWDSLLEYEGECASPSGHFDESGAFRSKNPAMSN